MSALLAQPGGFEGRLALGESLPPSDLPLPKAVNREHDAGEDNVVAVIRISGRAKLSGVETDLTYAALYTLRDGKVARGREYWTREEALEAAGVSE